MKRWVKERGLCPPAGRLPRLRLFLLSLCDPAGVSWTGQAGTAFHFLQGFWYRYLVDAKVAEVRRYMAASGCDVVEAIERVLELKVSGAKF